MRPEQKEQTMLAAIPALTKIAPEEAPKILGALAQNDPSLQVRSAAKEALGSDERNSALSTQHSALSPGRLS